MLVGGVPLVEIEIGKIEAGKKIHRYIRQLLPGVPLSGIHKMIRTGRVKLNGKKAKADVLLKVGDRVHLFMAEEDFQEVSKQKKKYGGIDADVAVVYEDEEILIVNKPIGLLTHGDGEEQKDTLVNRVLAYLYRKNELEEQSFTPAPAHRLDRNTSGLVIFGKTGVTLRRLAELLSQHRIRKWYLAVVQGIIESPGKIDVTLTRDVAKNKTYTGSAGSTDGKNRSDFLRQSSGKEAITLYEPLLTSNGTTLVKIELVHGRTHQIRAHFQSIGHPLLGDVKYGGGRLSRATGEHQWLHAYKLKLDDGREYFAPLPAEFKQQLLDLTYSLHDLQGANLL